MPWLMLMFGTAVTSLSEIETLSTLSAAARIILRALRVARSEFEYTVAQRTLSDVRFEEREKRETLTTSDAEEKADVYKRVPRNDDL